MALFVLQPTLGGVLVMWFTHTLDEEHLGVELCCDTCNKLAKDKHLWWYVRYNASDEYPSLWICNKCKEDLG